MRIVCSGASGLLGTALVRALRADGHEVVRLVRREPSDAAADGVAEVRWNPVTDELDPQVLAGADAVVNLSGAGIAGRRWTAGYQRTLVTSRTQTTGTLARAIAGLGADAPPVLLNGSAIGFYGDTGERLTDERAPQGAGFLADLVGQWEASARPAEQAGHTRVVYLRTGLALSGDGGLLTPLKLLTLAGLGGPLGSGRQYQPWISERDHVAAMQHLLGADVAGPVNVVGPAPVRQREFAKSLAAALHRPALLPTPAFALRIVLDGFADEGVLIGQRAVPSALVRSGFEFTDDTLKGALRWALDR